MPPIEPTTLGQLYRQHAPALRLYARQWADSADDLVQEAFVRLAQRSPPPGQVLPWLYRVNPQSALANHRSTTRRRQRETRSGQPRGLVRPWWFRLPDRAGILLPARRQRSWADQKVDDKPTEPKWLVDRSLTLTARAEPVPALKYRLYPLASELKEGNAVPIYLRLVHERNDETKREWARSRRMEQAALDQLPVARGPAVPREIRLHDEAARPWGGEKPPSGTTRWTRAIPSASCCLTPNSCGNYGGLLVLKARLEMAEGDYTAAAHTFQTGLAFSRHVTRGHS